ncbi:FecR family protein [Flavobacterium algicola]|uniref:FecR family protein n=1 Tax=Flavobacterium algicola TaxID=556529 RepID=UPI001EFCF9A2|nr:FecR domain-containing protein [Flavobacterium algicola]MCG9792398.1 FecR domain-containing protein [Flavobacterium algicola]
MKEEQFKELAAKYAIGTATPEEIKVVETFYKVLQEKQEGIPIYTGKNKKEKIFKSISAKIHEKKKFNFFSNKLIATAASLLLLLGIGYKYVVLNSQTIITVVAVKGERKEVLLPDNSRVFLNSNSSISYADNFEEERHLVLKGEAFFTVTKNPKKPFVVSSKTISTRVLGTSFNINSNSDTKTTISVNTGKVAVASASCDENKFFLTKNQQVTILKNETAKVTYTDSEDLMAWTKNIIVLNNETIENTAIILENWFDIRIDCDDENLKLETLSGKFKNEKLENIISSIALLKNLEIKYLTPKHILIRKKQLK